MGDAYSERHAKLCVRAVLEALRACHDAGLAHRQVRLEHVLCRDDDCERPLLTGFSTACSVRPRDFSKVPDERKAAPDEHYAAPELCSKDVQDFPRLRVLPAPDVWARAGTDRSSSPDLPGGREGCA